MTNLFELDENKHLMFDVKIKSYKDSFGLPQTKIQLLAKLKESWRGKEWICLGDITLERGDFSISNIPNDASVFLYDYSDFLYSAKAFEDEKYHIPDRGSRTIKDLLDGMMEIHLSEVGSLIENRVWEYLEKESDEAAIPQEPTNYLEEEAFRKSEGETKYS